jgi:cytochrome o ubiquinol oxidase subunit II
MKKLPFLRGLLAVLAMLPLAGCKYTVLDPKGSVGLAEKNLILISTWAMLLIIVPVIILTVVFAWHYRASNTKARFEPDWGHSVKIELFCWGIPSAIILFLAILTWNTTHALDPYRPLDDHKKPITIEVVAQNWKWMFIYPEQGIATINEVAFPEGTPVDFRITSDTVMNAFFIPELGSMIYAMAGMTTQINLIANTQGTFPGISAMYSGRGFSDMHFNAISTTPEKFQAWVENARKSPNVLTAADYPQAAAPEEKAPVRYYSKVEPNLFQEIIAKYLGKAVSFNSGMKE